MAMETYSCMECHGDTPATVKTNTSEGLPYYLCDSHLSWFEDEARKVSFTGYSVERL